MSAAGIEGVRPATADDVPALADLAAAAIDELAAMKGGQVFVRRDARQAPFDSSIAAAIADPDQCVVVGEYDSTPVGYGIVRLETLPDGSVLGVVDDLYTDPGAREVGVGEATMDALLDWCRSRGCFGVDAIALPGNRETKNFFETFGLVARAIVVHRSL